MNTENFAEYLKNPSQLYQLSYQELKTLVMQYPFCQNLHFLLLQKSKQDNHKEVQSNLERAATYSSNRHFLYQIMQENGPTAVKQDHLIMREEYLELKDLSVVEKVPEILIVQQEDPNAIQEEVSEEVKQQLQHSMGETPDMGTNPFLNSSGKDYEDINLSETLTSELLEDLGDDDDETPEFEWSVDEEGPAADGPERAPHEMTETPEAVDKPEGETPYEESIVEEVPKASEPPRIFQVSENIIQLIVSGTKVLNQMNYFRPDEKKEESILVTDNEPPSPEINTPPDSLPKPIPKSSFSSWIQDFQSSHVKSQLDELMEIKKIEELKKARKKRAKKKRKKNKVSLIAEKSLSNHQELASKTLAQVLVDQKQYNRAIAMYRKLIYLYPDEKTYFQARIEKIQRFLLQ